jgi:Ni,Fe-hydrogenase III small subunit
MEHTQEQMPKIWIFRGLRKGVLTTKYPDAEPNSEELPRRSMPPQSNATSDWLKGRDVCPTRAIEVPSTVGEKGNIDLGKCIYCRKCEQAGFQFSDAATSEALQARFAQQVSSKETLERYESHRKTFKRSFHILMIDVGSCNACNLEVLNLSNPYYDLQRLGIFFTNSPKHADALVVVGALNKAMVDVLKRTYESIPNPKLVIAVGACPISGGVFQTTSGFASPVKDAIHVDVVIPGCPPSPIQILQGLLMAMGKLKPKEAAI